jgi:hypothetical protein
MLAPNRRGPTFLTTGLILGAALGCAASETDNTDGSASGGTTAQTGPGGNSSTGTGGNVNQSGGKATGGKAVGGTTGASGATGITRATCEVNMPCTTTTCGTVCRCTNGVVSQCR